MSCCHPVCCVHTKKEVIAADNFLDRTFRRMTLNQNGGTKKERKQEIKTEIDVSDLNFEPETLKFPLSGPLELTKPQLLAIKECWDTLSDQQEFIKDFLVKLFEKRELRKPFLIPGDLPEGERLEDV